MKKIVASVAVVTMSVTGLHAELPLITSQAPKPWSVSATLRGFYDDNATSSLLESAKVEAFGVEVSPSAGLNWGDGQTALAARYTYSLKYYDKPLGSGLDRDTHQHLFDLALGHAFSERYQVEVGNSFAIGQEPDILRGGNTMFDSPFRVSGNNIRNVGRIRFMAELSPVFNFEVGYINNFADYADDRSATNTPVAPPSIPFVEPSFSGVLDRVEHQAYVKPSWLLSPQTILFGSYRFGIANHLSDEVVALEEGTLNPVFAESRDTRSHIGSIGVEHRFRPEFSVVLEGGVEFTEYPNDPNVDSAPSPYISASADYQYLPGSSVSLGFQHKRGVTDRIGSLGNLVTDSQLSVFYGSIQHQLLSRVYGTATLTIQNSDFDRTGTAITGHEGDLENQIFYLFDVQVEYRFNANLSTHVGYGHDRLDSNVGDFDRNRVYIGATARY